jgi:hypothetical protein
MNQQPKDWGVSLLAFALLFTLLALGAGAGCLRVKQTDPPAGRPVPPAWDDTDGPTVDPSQIEAGLSVARERGVAVPTSDYRLSRPFTHENLTVYFVGGVETLPAAVPLTLQEAMEQNVAVVRDGHPLTIENKSSLQEVYVQSGDVIKGGSQDRALRYDAMIAPGRTRSVEAWCVERGRSAPRGTESPVRFSRSPFGLGTADLRRSAGGTDQNAVWSAVERTQDLLREKCGAAARAGASPSSLQLTLESPAVRSAVEPYAAALGSALADLDAAIGYVAVVNGRVVTGDVYASRELFRKLWPKLLDGLAVEAVAGPESGSPAEPIGEEPVRAFLYEPEHAPSAEVAVVNRLRIRQWRGDRVTLVESWDRSRDNLVLHRSFVTR